jgi:hypothetical protein
VKAQLSVFLNVPYEILTLMGTDSRSLGENIEHPKADCDPGFASKTIGL